MALQLNLFAKRIMMLWASLTLLFLLLVVVIAWETEVFSAKLRLLFPPFESLNVGLWHWQRKKDKAGGRKILIAHEKLVSALVKH